ncbi:NAD-dependent epimerase/dehydratase family protein [Geminocystis sp. CENA526]|uniref:NAD-dependent epimerase/dehydratase family protein n=1 Tax=Geminocystis sp. CENA526 TaxID=1355871 RepID=UPI003D6DF255
MQINPMVLDSNLKIIIIGGEGFVGSAYVRFCQENNLDFLVINRSNYEQYIGTECDLLINANGNSKKFLAKDNPLLEFDESVRSVRRSIVDFPCKKYIFLSSCDVYPDCSTPESTKEDTVIDITQQSPYGFHKYLAEQCVRHCHNDWLIFRMGGFVGQGLKKNAIFDILYGEKLWLHPDSELQYIHTDTASKVVMEIISKGYTQEIFNLCGNGLVKLQDVIDRTDSKVKVNYDSTPVCYEVSIEKIESLVNIPSTHETVMNFVT